MEDKDLDTIRKKEAREQIRDTFGINTLVEDKNTEEKQRAIAQVKYAGKSAEVGFNKFLDLASIFDSSDERSNARKQVVLDAMRERDSFYVENKEDLTAVDSIVGGLVESISNPAELMAQIGVAVATGGSSIPVQIGAQLGLDLAQANIESYRYQDRLLTPKENLIVGGTSVLPDLLMTGAGALIRKNKSKILQRASNLGDETISPRATIDSFDNIGTDNMSKIQQIKTDFPDAVKEEVYDVKIKKPHNIYRERLLELSENNGNKDDVVSFLNVIDNLVKEKKGGKTYLQRTKDHYTFSEIIQDAYELKADDVALDNIYGKGFSKKTDIQKMVVIQNKENDVLDEFARNIEPTVSDYYTRWKEVKSKKPSEKVNIYLNTEQIENALNNIDTKFQTQKLYIQNEYLNIINKGYEDSPVDLNTFIKQIGADDKNVAEAWIKGNMNDIPNINRNEFFDRAYEDSVILDELNMKTSLFDVAEFESFNRKFSSSFDEAGDVKYDGNLFKSLSKANSDEKEILLRAMKDNPEQYVEFISNSKKILDGGQGTVSNEELRKKAYRELNELKSAKESYIRKNKTQELDKAREYWAYNVSNLKNKIKEAEQQIAELSNKKTKGKKQKISSLEETIEDLKAQLKNEDIALKEKHKEILSKVDTSEFDSKIKAKKEYLEKLKEIKDSVKDEDIKIFEEYFNTPYNSVKKYISKNKDFINSEYEKLTKDIPFEQSTDPKVWKYKVVASMANKKAELAKESIKINQTVNKQDLLAYVQRYYTDTVDRNTVGTVKLRDDMIDLFNSEIKPFYDNGVFKLQDGEDKATHFARFIAELKKTRASARVTGEYKSIGELREFFNVSKDGKKSRMSEFFINVNNKGFLKTNSEMIRDIFDFNTSAIARFSEYGSTSPYVLANKFKYKLNESMSKIYGKELSDAQKKVLNTAREIADRMFKSTQIGYASELPSSIEILSQQTRAGLRRGILGLSGIPELFGQNYFIGLSKAQKYSGFREYLNQIRRISKPIPEDFVQSKYTTAQLMKDVNMNNFGSQNKFWGKIDNFAFMFQDMSDKQMKRFGEGFSTSILHTLPEDFNLMENEMKDLLRMKGVDINNYASFRQFTKEHIDRNGYIVNIDELSKQIDFDSNKYADMLRSVHYQLSDYIGNPMHKAKFNTVAQDEISKWYGLFRGFSRNMNRDTLTRFTQYVDANGVAKNRFNKSYFTSSYNQLITPFGNVPSQIAKDLGLFTTATSALVVGGYGYSLAKEFIESDRTIKQKYAVIRAKADKIVELIQDKDILKVLATSMDITATNPLDTLSATDLPSTLFNRIKKVYNTFTDEEKITLGTNVEEGVQTLLEETAKTFLRIPNNVIQAVYKETQGDVETLPKKISNVDMTVFESYVRNNVPSLKRLIEIESENEMNYRQAQIDYMNNNTASYDKLSDNSKGIAEVILSNNTIKDVQDFKTHYAVVSKETETKEELVEKLANERPYDNIDTQGTINVLNQQQPKSDFEKLGEKKMNYFYMIMKYKGIDKPTQQDYDLFVKEFKDIKRTRLSNVLKEIYGIDKRDFDILYNNKDTRTKAINYYK